MGMDAGLGIAGVGGALSALRLFTASIAPKRVRVVTDIDDTVKSSGNKRLFGVPLGGIDAQCEMTGAQAACGRFRPKWCVAIYLQPYPARRLTDNSLHMN